ANCIKYLKKNQFGIATFLPLNKIRPVANRTETKNLLEQKGVRGLAIDLIEFDPKFRTIFSHVFGNTIVIENIEIARKLGIGTTRMVTLEGDLCEPSGAMIGGYRHKKSASFKEKGLADELNSSHNEIAALDIKIQRLEDSRKEHDEQITRMREVKANLEGDIIKTEKSLHLDTSDLDANQKYKKELQKQHEKAEQELVGFEEIINDKTQELTKIKISKQELREKLSHIRNPTILAELNAYEQKQKELTEQRITLDAEIKSINERITSVTEEIENAKKVILALANEQKEYLSNHDLLQKKVSEQETLARAKDKDLSQFYAQCKHLFEQRNTLSDTITKIENSVFKQEEQCRKEEFELNLHAVQEASIKAEIAGLQNEFQQYDGTTLDLKKTEEQLKTGISTCETALAGIGSVNMRALDIYDSAEKEYNTLVEKKNLLSTEKEHVLTFMQDIETQKESLFIETLTVINNNFKKNFLDLSKKGDAELLLELPQKPFDAGLLIHVRLAGEKFLDIRSLSGGEKTMTALAFLFAIQDHEPAPFYVLDEVDAALDKHNSEKLAKLVRAYTNKAQYLVISHNDAVLTEADTLYGVSMNEHGISQVVSVKA
ncbi:MAG: AAA family ATPase, partial [Candidatus Woesearchaeota archaeon]|nr:AAA family ATPase [Candidatus Woesearchaeota archaeon]